jgi:hypothetical protein
MQGQVVEFNSTTLSERCWKRLYETLFHSNKIKQRIDAEEIIDLLIIDLFRKNNAIRSDLCIFRL